MSEPLSAESLQRSLNDVQRKESIADLIAALAQSDREAFLDSLTAEQLANLAFDWSFWGRPAQIMPGTPGAEQARTDWQTWLLMAGRGFGKSRTGAEAVKYAVEVQGRQWVNLIGPTAADVRDVMVEGESGILSCYPADRAPLYEPSKRKLTWFDAAGDVKAIGKTFSADEPDRLRGPQCEIAWGDEIATWKYPEAWDNMQFGLRLGRNPQSIATTTPRPVKLVRTLLKDPTTVITRGSTYDNRANLAQSFYKTIIKKYEGTNLGRQEIYAELLDDNPNALWRRKTIEGSRVGNRDPHDMVRIVVAVDPAVSTSEDSNETGIIVAGVDADGHAYVYEDCSERNTPLGWAQRTVGAFVRHKADRVIAEINNGGNLVEANIRTVAPDIPYRCVRASRGKTIRAEPVAALYEQGRVHHVGMHEQLEDQMCEYMPGEESPDRMDALVWAITDLLIEPEMVEMYEVEQHHYRYRY